MAKAIINTNLFIALAAVALSLGSGLNLNFSNYGCYLLLVFSATLLDYNLHGLLKLKQSTDAYGKNRWTKKHLKLVWDIVGLSFIGTTVAILNLEPGVFKPLIFAAFFTLAYSFPFEAAGLSKLDPRRITGLKTGMIAIAWTLITLYIPMQMRTVELKILPLALHLFERFLFIFAITIPFDIKDTKEDKKHGLKTIPVILGEVKAIQFSCYLLYAFVLISIFRSIVFGPLPQSVTAVIIAVLSITLITSEKLKRKEYYYPVLLDGTILVYGGLLIAASFLI